MNRPRDRVNEVLREIYEPEDARDATRALPIANRPDYLHFRFHDAWFDHPGPAAQRAAKGLRFAPKAWASAAFDWETDYQREQRVPESDRPGHIKIPATYNCTSISVAGCGTGRRANPAKWFAPVDSHFSTTLWKCTATLRITWPNRLRLRVDYPSPKSDGP